MGQCCIPASLRVAPEVYAGPNGLPEGIVQVTDTSDQKLIDEFINVIAQSFCGTQESAPEAALSWMFDPSASGENSAGCLTDVPSDARVKFFKSLGGIVAHTGFRHGGCFALKNSDGKIVCATVTIPPNNKSLYNTGLWEFMDIAKKLGGMGNIAPERKGGEPAARMSKLDAAMKKSHKAHAPGLHLYVLAFATALGQQGNGHGRKLMTFLTESARRMDVPAYLECSGKRNERFYGKNGYKMMQRYAITHKDQKFNADGLEGMAAMVFQNGQ